MATPTINTRELLQGLLAKDGLPRLLLEADLKPVQGDRFQPTGFPDLGAATYTLADGTEMLLIESAQSVANRLEDVCWDHGRQDLVELLAGLPYVRVTDTAGKYLTSSIQEFHRLNSPYILEGNDKSFFNLMQSAFNTAAIGPVDTAALASFVFKHDPNSLIHGLFVAKKELAGGRLRLPRLLGGFVEARDVRPAESGGVKFDRVDPSGDTSRGFGHVPFHRTEYTAGRITAYFSLDLALLRGYRLPDSASVLIVALAIWRIGRLLQQGLRLRTACDFDAVDVRVTRPATALPPVADLEKVLPDLIAACCEHFASPPVSVVRWEGSTRPSRQQSRQTEETDDEDGGGA